MVEVRRTSRRKTKIDHREYFGFTGVWPSDDELNRINADLFGKNGGAKKIKPIDSDRNIKAPQVKLFANCFLPKGRSASIIYLVQVRSHLDVVKIGRTTKWAQRRKCYENWNLSPGNGVVRERLFIITEEFVDLPALEKFLIASMPYEKAFGEEWFYADFDEAVEHVEGMVTNTRLSYV